MPSCDWFFQDFNEDESESDEESTSESEGEDENENDASNEEDYTSSGEARTDGSDDEHEVDINLSAENLRKLLPCSVEEFEKVTPFYELFYC